jgi:hypothetical protein
MTGNMKNRLLFLTALLLVIIGCNKNGFNTRPSIKIKSVDPTVVGINSSMLIELEFTDKEGDISNSIFIQKIRLNKVPVPTIRDSFSLPVPDFPGKSKGFIKLLLDYQNHLVSAVNPPGAPANPEPDTLIIRMALKDKGNNVSDTVSTEQVVIIR